MPSGNSGPRKMSSKDQVPFMQPSQVQNRWVDCLYIVCACILLAILLRPFHDQPYSDDWCHAWPVEHLLKTGEFANLAYSSNLHVTQVLWGTLFCLPMGFSFAALRVSVWVLGMAGLCIFYLMLRELDVSRRDSLIGAAILAFNPIFFVLQYTFMTDVPFIAVTISATYLFLR